MKKHKPQPKLGTQIKLNLTNLNCLYGTVDQKECKSIYIQVGTWIKLNGEKDTLIKTMERYGRNLKCYIRGQAIKVSPDYLYSLIDFDITDKISKKYYTNQIYLTLEITILFKKPIPSFKTDIQLHKNISTLCELIEDKMNTGDLTLTKRRIKETLSQLV